MLKQICFFRKRPDMTMDEFMDYYENQHSQLAQKMGARWYGLDKHGVCGKNLFGV